MTSKEQKEAVVRNRFPPLRSLREADDEGLRQMSNLKNIAELGMSALRAGL